MTDAREAALRCRAHLQGANMALREAVDALTGEPATTNEVANIVIAMNGWAVELMAFDEGTEKFSSLLELDLEREADDE